MFNKKKFEKKKKKIQKIDPWKINFIDKMLRIFDIQSPLIINQRKILKKFRLASFSIDTGAQIYAERVDNLYDYCSGFLKILTCKKKRNKLFLKDNIIKGQKKNFISPLESVITSSTNSKIFPEKNFFVKFLKQSTTFFCRPFFFKKKNYFKNFKHQITVKIFFCLSYQRSKKNPFLCNVNHLFDIFLIDLRGWRINKFQSNLQKLNSENKFYLEIFLNFRNSLLAKENINIFSNEKVYTSSDFFQKLFNYSNTKINFLSDNVDKRNHEIKKIYKFKKKKKRPKIDFYSKPIPSDFFLAQKTNQSNNILIQPKNRDLFFLEKKNLKLFKKKTWEENFSTKLKIILKKSPLVKKIQKEKSNYENIKNSESFFFEEELFKKENNLNSKKHSLLIFRKFHKIKPIRILIQEFIDFLKIFCFDTKTKVLQKFKTQKHFNFFKICCFLTFRTEKLYKHFIEKKELKNYLDKKFLNFFICFLHYSSDNSSILIGDCSLNHFLVLKH